MYDIYPKQLSRRKIQPKPHACFVLMPFKPEFDAVYAELKTAMTSVGFACNRADDLYENKPIMTNIVTEILCSHFVIADLTSRNPNVFYEVGITHVCRDIPNVILISQSMDHVPFDLRHLPILLYELDNLLSLSVRLKKMVLENKNFFEGEVALKHRYYHRVKGDYEFDALVEYIKNVDDAIWRLFLRANQIGLERQSSESPISGICTFRNELSKLVRRGQFSLFLDAYMVFLDVVSFYFGNDEVDEFVRKVLTERNLGIPLDQSVNKRILVDFATTAYTHPKHKRQSIEWMFGYLSNNKVAGVDLTRAKIEAFVLNNPDPELADAIINTLSHQNPVIREAMADFIGEMRLAPALPTVLTRLIIEDNPYTARSLIVAAGKLGIERAGPAILDWLERRKGWISKNNYFFIHENAYRATRELDRLCGTEYTEKLQQLLETS